MSRTNNAFNLLQAVASVVGIAIIFWSLGLPSLRFVEAAAVTSFSDTLSDSAPSALSNHTIVFTTPTGLTAGQSIVITFDGLFDLGTSTGAEDIDIASTTDYSVQNGSASGETWGIATTTSSITLTSGSAVLDANATVTIQIGTNATFGSTGNSRIENPGSVGSYDINVTAGADTGETKVAIVQNVQVTASVDTNFEFTVSGMPAGFSINGTTTTGSSSAISIPFGALESGVASTAAQRLEVLTNASNGFVVTVTADSQLISATGADIDGFANGNYNATAIDWIPPTGTLGTESTYGHWGITTNDNSVGETLTDDFDVGGTGQEYVSASTTPVEVFRHDGPADAEEIHVGQTEVGYTVQISAFQEAGDDYTATLTYVATPVF